MTLYHLRRIYTESDLELSMSMLNRFSFVSIMENMATLTPLFLKEILGWNETDVHTHRSGTRGKNSAFSVIAGYPDLIKLAIETADLSLDLYLHATRIACYQYYQLKSSF